jgi:DNA-directed RNA polymerase subunit RPC12/RpoP
MIFDDFISSLKCSDCGKGLTAEYNPIGKETLVIPCQHCFYEKTQKKSGMTDEQRDEFIKYAVKFWKIYCEM